MIWLYALILCGAALAYSPEENRGFSLFQGDMKLTPAQKAALESGPNSRGAGTERKWIKGFIPFTIDKSLRESGGMPAFWQGKKDWEKRTCIKLRRKGKKDKDYVNFIKGDGCWSFVGRRGGKQDLSLGQGCWIKGIVSHEIGHAVGFWHEQSRRDRDKFVSIIRENIQEGREHNFNIISSIKSLGVRYDYGSVMHYGATAFSKNGKPTIIPKKKGVTIGQRRALSKLDVKQANLLYRGECKKRG